MSLSDDVILAAEDEYSKWKSSARQYAALSLLLRPFLIASTSIIAAEKTLGSYFTNTGPLFPLLSVCAAIGTGLEAWLKPREKWKGFLADRDKMDGVRIRARSIDPNDTVGLYDCLKEIKELQARHVKDNVY
jgi:hypothetical protein